MNAIFALVFLLSLVLFLAGNPDGFLSALLAGAQKAGVLALSLLTTYCVFLGFFKVLERSGLAGALTRAAYPLARRLFKTDDKTALLPAVGNLTANLLGLPGAPTPLGIRATSAFLEKGNLFGAELLFVLNATSLQLLPATAISLRLAAGSSSPADIFLPTLLSTLFSTLLGAALLFILRRRT